MQNIVLPQTYCRFKAWKNYHLEFVALPRSIFDHYFVLENSLFFIWILMVIGLIDTLVHCVLLTEAELIRNILKKHTLDTLLKIDMNEFGKSMENKIDGLSIIDILRHTDYTNKKEERDVISDIMVDINDRKLFANTLCKGKKGVS